MTFIKKMVDKSRPFTIHSYNILYNYEVIVMQRTNLSDNFTGSNDKIKVSDRREPGYFTIDNEILDNYNISPIAFLVYAWLSRYSGKKDPFISISKLAKDYKKSRNTIRESVNELVDKKLIEKTIQGNSGVSFYALLKVDKTPKSIVSDRPPPELVETTPRSVTDHPLVPDRPQRRLTKEDLENKTNKEEKKISEIDNSKWSSEDMNTLRDFIVKIFPSMLKNSGSWWQIQTLHLKRIKKQFPDLTADYYKNLILAHHAGKRNGEWWNNPTDLRCVSENMLPHLQDYAEKNKGAVNSVNPDHVSEYALSTVPPKTMKIEAVF